MAEAPVEKPAHADAVRIRHLDGPALVDALDLDRPELATVRRARLDRGEGDAVPELLAHFASGHRPRPIPSMRTHVAELGENERQGVLAAAEAALETGGGSFTDRGLGRSRLYGHHYLGWTRPVLQAYALTGETRWLTSWGEIFDRWYAVRDEVHGDWPGLDVIWYTLGVASRTRLFADALDLGGAALPAATRIRLLGSVLGGARWLADEHDSFRYGNWQVVGVCCLATLAALFPEFAEAPTWAGVARERIEEHLALDIDDDGGHLERSPGYHRLCLTSLHDAALHAEAYLGWDLGRHPRLKLMHDWLIDLATPDGWLPPFQDSGIVAVGPLLVRGHYLFGVPAYKGLASRLLQDEVVRAQLTPLPPRHGNDPYAVWKDADSACPERPLVHLSGSRYVVMREGWDPGALYAALNAGPEIPHELESHSHRACLDFVLWGHGVPLAWEAGGPQSYDDPSYYSWFQSTGAHNTVLLEGAHLGPDRDATVEVAEHLQLLDVVVAHHDGWGPRHRRTLVFVRPGPGRDGYWIVHDDVAGPGQWRWLLHGLSPWVEQAPGTFASSQGPGLVAHLPHARSAAWTMGEGTTSVPRVGEPSWQTLYGLDIALPSQHLTAVLVPFGVRGRAGVRVERGDGKATSIRDGEVVDEFVPGAWTRRSGERIVAAATWNGSSAVVAGQVVAAAPRSRTLVVRWPDDGADCVVAHVEATHRTTVSIAVRDVRDVRVDGIAVPYEQSRTGVSVTVPWAGRWTVRIRS